MNTDPMQGKWHQMKGAAKQQWGKLTEDDLAHINGIQERLAGRIQERYGIDREEADRQIEAWLKTHRAA